MLIGITEVIDQVQGTGTQVSFTQTCQVPSDPRVGVSTLIVAVYCFYSFIYDKKDEFEQYLK